MICLSRDQPEDDDDDDNGDDNWRTAADQLPGDEWSAAKRSRRVFYALAAAPEEDAGGERRLDASRMEEAMWQCGLDGEACSKMYAVSKWANKSDANAKTLDLVEFQSIIERFSSPVRLERRLRRRVEDHVAERGLRFVYTVDEQLRTDTPAESSFGVPSACVVRTTARTSPVESELREWDELLDGLADVSM